MGLLQSLIPSLAPRPDAVQVTCGPDSICAPATGRVISLSDVGDPVFARGMLGEGLAIAPEGDVAYSPVTGTVTAVVGSKHAVAVRSQAGAEVLVHVGVDTVALKGKGFRTFVEKGAQVRAGEPLISFDRKLIEESGLDTTVIVTVTNPDDFARVAPLCAADGTVAAGEALLLAAQAA